MHGGQPRDPAVEGTKGRAGKRVAVTVSPSLRVWQILCNSKGLEGGKECAGEQTKMSPFRRHPAP